MKAFIVDRYGSKDGVRAGDMPDPELREDDVLVQIHAAGVNLLDAKIRDGEFKRFCRIASRSFWAMRWLGSSSESDLECSDSSQATRSMRGQMTIASALSRNSLRSKKMPWRRSPEHLTMEEAASIPLVGLTAWQVLIERANLKKGQKVLIHAGSGGVGTVAIQLAKHLVRRRDDHEHGESRLVKRLGADVVIDYRKDDFENILQDYDVVLNSLGAETLEKISPRAQTWRKAHLDLRSA